MASIGRNDPCPCGSGKKWKHCCLRTEETAHGDGHRAMRLHDLDHVLVQRLLEHAAKAHGRTWMPAFLDRLEMDEVPQEMLQLVVPCAVYDWRTDGSTLAERFAASGRADERERGWLAAQHHAWLSIWEVQSLEPGVAIGVRDLFTGEERRVLERTGSRLLTVHDAVLARVVDFDGLTVFCGMHPRSLSPRAGGAVYKRLKKLLRTRTKTVGIEKLREGIPIEDFIIEWDDAVAEGDLARMQIPELRNTDGEPLLMTNDRYAYEPNDRPRLEAKLAELGEGDDDRTGETCFVVLRDGNAMHKSWENTVVGRVVVRARELVVETNSILRADDLRGKVEALLGPMIRHRARDHADPTVGLRERSRKPVDRSPPPPEALDVMREMKRRHYEDWLDTPVPALSGVTPREAAKHPRRRTELVTLLKEIENQEGRLPTYERIDLAPLWNELGLAK